MRACLRVRPQISGLRGAFGRSLLHYAAELGDAAACEALLGSFAEAYGEHVELLQALELYQDAFAVTAGELALIGRHHDVFDLLVTKACSRQRPSNYSREANKAYVKERLKYEGDVLFDAAGRGVMMGWEDPLMARHAELLAPRPGLSVLNIGFGLGLVDGYLQARRPSAHVIVEAHPDVYAEIRRRGWMEKPGLGVIHGRWQDVARDIIAQGPYDGVFFDTYAEMYGDMQDFFALLPELVRTGGRFSFFNGLSDKNIYAQAVSCRIAQIDLAKLGFACLYEPVVLGEVGDDEWCKVATKYWSLETYYLPLAIRLPSQEDLAHGVGVELPTGALRASAVQVDDRVGPVLSEKMERAQQEMRVAAQ